MNKVYTLEDNEGLMAELKSMRGKVAEMRERLGDMVKALLARTATSDGNEEETAPRKSPKGSLKPRDKKSQAGISKKRREWTKEAIEQFGIDASNLPPNSKLIRRKDKESGYDIWYVELITYVGPKLERRRYCIGRFNVPGGDPMCSKYPESIIQGNPMTPSLAAFYFDQKFVNAYISDKRMSQVIDLINGLFMVERQAKDMSFKERKAFRRLHSRPLVTRLFFLLHKMRRRKDDYGKMVNDAVDYILDDEKAFKAFLKHGRIELSNSAAERMFRHIAMGRRRSALPLGSSKNWLHSGSHDAAQNIAFMYSLYESCKLNDLNFFNYIEDVLTRLMKGETDYKSLIPCNYKPLPSVEEQKEVA